MGLPQHSLFSTLERQTEKSDNVALFVDWSKAFYVLSYDLLMVSLNAYGLDYKSMDLISSFLSNRKYRSKINSSFCDWEYILTVAPLG